MIYFSQSCFCDGLTWHMALNRRLKLSFTGKYSIRILAPRQLMTRSQCFLFTPYFRSAELLFADELPVMPVYCLMSQDDTIVFYFYLHAWKTSNYVKIMKKCPRRRLKANFSYRRLEISSFFGSKCLKKVHYSRLLTSSETFL